MEFVRKVLPFLFVRNWHSGQWELSTLRLMALVVTSLLLLVGILMVLALGSPAIYSTALSFV